MELNKAHREALTDKLIELLDSREHRNLTSQKFRDEGNEVMYDYFQVSLFLIDKQIDLIREGLKNNEIDW